MRKALALLLLLVPGLAAAALVPPGQDAWSFYTMGGGEAVAQILGALKGILAPDGGIKTLLLFVSTLGMFMLAVFAGFAPSQHGPALIKYVVGIALVFTLTLHVKAPVAVHDPVSNYYQVVSDVPAVVAVPLGVISEAGNWLTAKSEQFMAMPGTLQMTQGATFNMANKLVADSERLRITNPNLRMSLTAYFADCVIVEMAKGNISLAAIQAADPVWTALASVNKGVMTRYYGFSSPAKPATLPAAGGDLISCDDAYTRITGDLSEHGEELQGASFAAFGGTGAAAGLAAGMQDALTYFSNGGYQGTGKDFIMQRAFINSLSGFYRNASVQTGTDENLLAASVEQAEQNQKSAWVTGFITFNNMMPYVYVILHGFLIGITPFVLVMLFLPGVGGKLALSYIKVLVWLALWQPTFAIINFLVTLFTKAAVAPYFTSDMATLTLQNAGVITEQANTMIIAAQFMGTMTPLITWGIVSGAFAFTEFISHGIGNQFAAQAGAAAASGNLSMGNMSMGQTMMNKYDTSMVSTVGQQGVRAAFGGAMTTAHNLGGNAVEVHGRAATFERSTATAAEQAQARAQVSALNRSISHDEAVQRDISAAKAWAFGIVSRSTTGGDYKVTAADQAEAAKIAASLEKDGRQASNAETKATAMEAAAKLKATAGLSLEVGVSATAEASARTGAQWDYKQQRSTAAENSTGEQSKAGKTGSTGNSGGNSADVTKNGSVVDQAQDLVKRAETWNEGISASIQARRDEISSLKTTYTEKLSVPDAVHVGALDSARGEHQAGLAAIRAKVDAPLAAATKEEVNALMPEARPTELTADKVDQRVRQTQGAAAARIKGATAEAAGYTASAWAQAEAVKKDGAQHGQQVRQQQQAIRGTIAAGPVAAAAMAAKRALKSGVPVPPPQPPKP